MCYCKWPAFLAILPRVILPVCNMQHETTWQVPFNLRPARYLHFTYAAHLAAQCPFRWVGPNQRHSCCGKQCGPREPCTCNLSFGNFVGSELSFLYSINLTEAIIGIFGIGISQFQPIPIQYSLWAMGRTCGHRPLGRTSGRPLADVAKEKDFLLSRSGFLHVAFHEVRPPFMIAKLTHTTWLTRVYDGYKDSYMYVYIYIYPIDYGFITPITMVYDTYNSNKPSFTLWLCQYSYWKWP